MSPTDDTTLDRVYVRARRHLPALSTSPVACRHSCIPNDCHPRCVLSPRPSPGAILDVATQTLTKKGVAALGCSKGIGAPCSEQLAVTRSTLLSRMLCAHAFPAVDDWRGTCARGMPTAPSTTPQGLQRLEELFAHHAQELFLRQRLRVAIGIDVRDEARDDVVGDGLAQLAQEGTQLGAAHEP